jgi:hypothetical protein
MGTRRNIRLLRIVQALVEGANEGEGRKERTDMSDEFYIFVAVQREIHSTIRSDVPNRMITQIYRNAFLCSSSKQPIGLKLFQKRHKAR